MFIETIVRDWTLARETNTTDSSYPSRVPRNSGPSGTGANASQTTAASVYDLAPTNGLTIQNLGKLVLFGTGSDGNTLNALVLAWRKVNSRPGGGQTVNQNIPGNTIWIPEVLCEVQGTLSSGSPGVAGTIIPATMLFAKTITIVTGNAGVSVDVISPATAAQIATVTFDMRGTHYLEVIFKTNSSATDANALLTWF